MLTSQNQAILFFEKVHTESVFKLFKEDKARSIFKNPLSTALSYIL